MSDLFFMYLFSVYDRVFVVLEEYVYDHHSVSLSQRSVAACLDDLVSVFPIENTRGTVCGEKNKGKPTKATRDRLASTRWIEWMDGSMDRAIVSIVSFPRARTVPPMFRALTRRVTSLARASTRSSPVVRHRFATAVNAARDAAPVWTGDEADEDRGARARNVFARFGSPEAVTFAHRGIASGVEAGVSGGRARRERVGEIGGRARGERGFEATRDGEGGETEVDARVRM